MAKLGEESNKASNLSNPSGMNKGDVKYAFYHFTTSGAAVAVATSCTHPLDVLKVRLQMQLAGQRGHLIGMGETFARIVKIEGPGALYLGLAPALTRSVLYGGLRIGLYEPCKYTCDLMFDSTNIIVKIASGAFSGAIATALTNPTEVLKVRLQMNSNSGRGPIKEVRQMVANDGMRSLWKGVGPAMARASALTASQLATYDESKQALLKWTPLEEGFHLHLISSSIAGTVGTLVTAPVDIIKTRLMLQQGVKKHINGFQCAYQGVRNICKTGTPDCNHIPRLREAAGDCWNACHLAALASRSFSSHRRSQATCRVDAYRFCRILHYSSPHTTDDVQIYALYFNFFERVRWITPILSHHKQAIAENTRTTNCILLLIQVLK